MECYRCFKCSEFFSAEKEAIKHLKKVCFIKENKDPIYCLKNNGCQHYSLTFRHLKVHMKSCITSVERNGEINHNNAQSFQYEFSKLNSNKNDSPFKVNI